MKVKVEVSNRHIHLTKETYDQLFNEEIGKIKDLSQLGQFVSDKVVTLKTDKYEIENVKLLGPLRSYDQIEISKTDARKFGINPPVRASGDLEGAETIIIKTPKKEIAIKGCIIAQRHIHMNTETSEKLGLKDKQKVTIKVLGDKSGFLDAYVKVSSDGVFVAHVDNDDGNSFLIENNDELELFKLD